MSILVNKPGRGRSPVLRPVGAAWWVESCSHKIHKTGLPCPGCQWREVPAFTTPEPFLGNVWDSKAKTSVGDCSNSFTEWRAAHQHLAYVLTLFSLLLYIHNHTRRCTLHIFSSQYPAKVRKDYTDHASLPSQIEQWEVMWLARVHVKIL